MHIHELTFDASQVEPRKDPKKKKKAAPVFDESHEYAEVKKPKNNPQGL
jgi:hypothetical protein